ncbi:MAG: hypothetical protein OXE97_03810, partial [Gammaproteobacteria bacterium]|nr:hypothetical protein [Gammaproteobacteria bacterium]
IFQDFNPPRPASGRQLKHPAAGTRSVSPDRPGQTIKQAVTTGQSSRIEFYMQKVFAQKE